MKYFECAICHRQIFFYKSVCDHCLLPIGYVASEKELCTFKKQSPTEWIPVAKQYRHTSYKPCHNYTHYQVCNWMIPSSDEEDFCESCQLTHVIPNLENTENLIYWFRLEEAKRRFLYLALGMNMMPRPKYSENDPFGIRFDFILPEEDKPVLTGHSNGVITLNAIEADVVYRETTRVNMGENYRTLLGHFRHESGHYYFNVMQHLHPELLDEFRLYFGNEQQDYSQSLERHYNKGAPINWQENYISSYASAHPWEDWAETWAHYLHMMETLETAYYAGLRVQGNNRDLASMNFKECPIGGQDFEHILENWITLTFNLNALNRSMGLEDAYPFKLSESVKDKLRFIHRHVLEKVFK
ncbi:putative zinc-binding metallopeptidase [Acinetobacter sp. 10FS3-1]|uniref:zinc-binding metallopeptidase family protein n=1 Tax=Acinetobacter sp. 10FS3-1 TaxID=2563897 RepID=UPI00157D1DCE|nr:putative zinc-binding metallopeptidase [Acinetobacter sp. 10FS3-1]MDM1780334.1 putative zinc-binding metallopeptidase [Acinetobacter indicus]QKQ70058.1 hypothetical protein E5Y90_07340 [Acinetobacter sp. 10FS3-1]